MRPRIFDLPEEHTALASWLDRGMVGTHLGEIIAELEAVHAGNISNQPGGIEAILGDLAGDVLQQGLAVLPVSKLRVLLRNPRLLLDLQERVLIEGGNYWGKLTRDDAELAKAVAKDWVVVERKIKERAAKNPVIPIEQSAARTRKTSGFWLNAWAKVMTIAASVLGLLYAAELNQRTDNVAKNSVPVVAHCGWNDDSLLTRVESTPEFLIHLADAAAECLGRPVDSADAEAKRLTEFRAGCTRLIVAVPRLKSLRNQADRDWLLERCRAWAGKLDVAIHDLENDAPIDKVRASVDDIVKHLIEALRTRAKSVA